MKCGYCNVIIKNKEDISFCEYCGAKLELENKNHFSKPMNYDYRYGKTPELPVEEEKLIREELISLI